MKTADVFGIEKVWGAIYEKNRQHGDFSSKKGKYPLNLTYSGIFYAVRHEEVCSTMVGRA